MLGDKIITKKQYKDAARVIGENITFKQKLSKQIYSDDLR